MSRQNVEIVRRLYQHWGGGDFATAEYFDPEIQFARIGDDFTGIVGEWRGVAQLSKETAQWLRPWDAVRHNAERVIDLGDGRVLVLSRASGNQKGSNVRVSQKSADLFNLREGKIVRWEAYGDRAEGTVAAGLSD